MSPSRPPPMGHGASFQFGDPAHVGNVFRYCPRCGEAALAPGPDNSLRCAACGLRWYYNAAAAVDVILERADGHILVTRRDREPGRGLLDLPGGFANTDESIEDAARREGREETGIVIGVLSYFGSFPNRYHYGDLLYFAIDLIFRASIGSDAAARAGDDASEARFVAPGSLIPGDIGLPSTRAAIAAYQRWLRAPR